MFTTGSHADTWSDLTPRTAVPSPGYMQLFIDSFWDINYNHSSSSISLARGSQVFNFSQVSKNKTEAFTATCPLGVSVFHHHSSGPSTNYRSCCNKTCDSHFGSTQPLSSSSCQQMMLWKEVGLAATVIKAEDLTLPEPHLRLWMGSWA